MSQYLGDISAYALAVSQGYTGTEEEYAELMASYATVGQTAVTAAQTATTKASEAATSATTATNKATEATTAATTATTKAAEAQADADAAALDASQALSAASTATTKATEATTAAATATSAATTATTAKDDAVSAKTAAQTAQTGAETAAASVSASAAQIATNTEDISQLKSEIADMQSDGVVPSAGQILSDKGVTDCVPYHYRKTGGDGADRLYDQIVGGTVNWNQLVPNANKTFTNTNTTDTRDFVMLRFVVGSGTTFKGVANVSTASVVEKVLESPATGNGALRHNGSARDLNLVTNIPVVSGHKLFIHVKFNSADPTTVGGVSTDEQMILDLTAMFGTTIADYIYQLEQTHAGDGVAFFKSLFPNDYYPYNAGELLSVSGLSEHKMVGFNQWDEEWELGGIENATGLPFSANDRIRSKNFCKCVPNTVYHGAAPTAYLSIFWYDANENFIAREAFSNRNATSPSNAVFFKIVLTDTTTYNHDICINISDPAKNGQYKPYKAHSYQLDSSLTLRGLFKLDANNKFYADGDTYDADGTVTRRYGIVDLGTLNWTYIAPAGGGGERFNTNSLASVIKKATANNIAGSLLTSEYQTVGATTAIITDKSIGVYTDGDVLVRDTAYTDAASFKAAMSGVMLVYELATPTTEEAEPYQHLQQCDPNGTEEYVSTGIVPIGHNSFYPENLRAKVEQLPWNFASLIAPTESTFTATRNYTTGSLFIVNNVLYKATSNIANGGTITPNTNCTTTTLAEIINALA